jgi:hypothetical protein
MSCQYDPTPEQRKAIEAYVNGSLLPLLGTMLTKQLGMAAVFMHEKLSEPTLGGGRLDPVHPNHRADLRYVRETLQMALPALKNTRLREQIEAAINGMTYIINRTEEAATRGVKGGSDVQP